jgi:hypothetical protein
VLSGTSPRSMLAVWEVRCTAIQEANDRRQMTSRDYGLHLWNKWVQAVGDEERGPDATYGEDIINEEPTLQTWLLAAKLAKGGCGGS